MLDKFDVASMIYINFDVVSDDILDFIPIINRESDDMYVFHTPMHRFALEEKDIIDVSSDLDRTSKSEKFVFDNFHYGLDSHCSEFVFPLKDFDDVKNKTIMLFVNGKYRKYHVYKNMEFVLLINAEIFQFLKSKSDILQKRHGSRIHISHIFDCYFNSIEHFMNFCHEEKSIAHKFHVMIRLFNQFSFRYFKKSYKYYKLSCTYYSTFQIAADSKKYVKNKKLYVKKESLKMETLQTSFENSVREEHIEYICGKRKLSIFPINKKVDSDGACINCKMNMIHQKCTATIEEMKRTTEQVLKFVIDDM